ncbi:hypothetical protein F4604DRAFT_1673518 [Suillus subluteus]|nr:hypothetical protein F4604DRAFT_1673518 [Suillus subluteus]
MMRNLHRRLPNPGATHNTLTGPGFYFGIGPPPVPELPAPRFNFGMHIPTPPAPSAAPSPPAFNFGMNLDIPAVPLPTAGASPAKQQPFNLGWNLPIPIRQPTPAAPSTLIQQPFNLGFNLLIRATKPDTAASIPSLTNQPTPATTSQVPFNLGFNLPMQATLAIPATSLATSPSPQLDRAPPATSTPQHVGYDSNNQLQPADISAATPPIHMPEVPAPMVVQPTAISAATPPVHMPAEPVTPPVEYKALILPKVEMALQPPTLASLVTDAKEAAMDIIRHLGGEEFDELAQMMVGSTLGPDDDIRDPTPEEILESNRVMLLAFCENRDRLTRIFKDLISLHHVAHVHEHIVLAVDSLLQEVESAEAKVATQEEVDM